MPGKASTNWTEKSSKASTNWTVKSSKASTNCHWPTDSGVREVRRI